MKTHLKGAASKMTDIKKKKKTQIKCSSLSVLLPHRFAALRATVKGVERCRRRTLCKKVAAALSEA